MSPDSHMASGRLLIKVAGVCGESHRLSGSCDNPSLSPPSSPDVSRASYFILCKTFYGCLSEQKEANRTALGLTLLRFSTAGGAACGGRARLRGRHEARVQYTFMRRRISAQSSGRAVRISKEAIFGGVFPCVPHLSRVPDSWRAREEVSSFASRVRRWRHRHSQAVSIPLGTENKTKPEERALVALSA